MLLVTTTFCLSNSLFCRYHLSSKGKHIIQGTMQRLQTWLQGLARQQGTGCLQGLAGQQGTACTRLPTFVSYKIR